MNLAIMQVEDLHLTEDFVFQDEQATSLPMQPCSICSNCCYSDCTGGN